MLLLCDFPGAALLAVALDDLKQYVELHRTPPDPVFYDVIYHSYGIVPALANPAYYTCKLTSAMITTLMTGGSCHVTLMTGGVVT